MDKYHKLCVYTDFRGEVDICISDVADFIGYHIPALLQKKSLTSAQISAVSKGLPLIIQQVLENVVK